MRPLTCAELVSRADVALLENDSTALALAATELAKHMGDPLTGRLIRFASVCRQPGGHAPAWRLLRQAIRDRIAIAGT